MKGTGYYLASGLTAVIDRMGFNANEDFTSTDAARMCNSVALSDGLVHMQNIYTIYPPVA